MGERDGTSSAAVGARPAAGVVCAPGGGPPDGEDAVALARITWARGVENGRDTWTCQTCSRRFLRSIEGKLDSTWG